jgi:DNA topoisomerase IB
VAEQLGNTPAVCRKSYIHPRALAAISIRLVQSNAGDDRGEQSTRPYRSKAW